MKELKYKLRHKKKLERRVLNKDKDMQAVARV